MAVFAPTVSIVVHLGLLSKLNVQTHRENTRSVFDGSSVKLQRADSTRQELPTHIFIIDLHNIQTHLTLKHFITHSASKKQDNNDIFL